MNDAKISWLNSLVYELAYEEKEKLSLDEFKLLLADRAIYAPVLLSSVRQEVDMLSSVSMDNIILEDFPDTFLWNVTLLGLMQEPELYDLILQLCEKVDVEVIDAVLGEQFIIAELPYILALAGYGNWRDLCRFIDDQEQDQDMRESFLAACVYMVAEGNVAREEILAYIHTKLLLSLQIEEDAVGDGEWNAALIEACSDLGIQENTEIIETIKELFGLGLVDTSIISINAFLAHPVYDVEILNSRLNQYIEQFLALDQESGDVDVDGYENVALNKNLELIAKFSERRAALSAFLGEQKIGRNEACHCLSGKKYKKCCLNQPVDMANVRVEEMDITYDALDSDEVGPEAKKAMKTVCSMISDGDLLDALSAAQDLKEQFPHLPQGYNYLYACLQLLDKKRDAARILKETREKFPNYLINNVLYGHYLLQRGEPEKIAELFNNCKTLRQLYPERTVFHITEVEGFFGIIGLYNVAMNDFQQAKQCLTLLKGLDSENEIIDRLQNAMYRKVCITPKDTELPVEILLRLPKKNHNQMVV